MTTDTDERQRQILRDHFAGQALQGLIAREIRRGASPRGATVEHQIAIEAYRYADAMMLQRDRDHG